VSGSKGPAEQGALIFLTAGEAHFCFLAYFAGSVLLQAAAICPSQTMPAVIRNASVPPCCV
jgi:hypothetical protein